LWSGNLLDLPVNLDKGMLEEFQARASVPWLNCQAFLFKNGETLVIILTQFVQEPFQCSYSPQ
jgi:hypothetical protein